MPVQDSGQINLLVVFSDVQHVASDDGAVSITQITYYGGAGPDTFFSGGWAEGKSSYQL